MTDPIVAAARRLIGDAVDTLRRTIDGLSAEALNWRPAGPETNSIAVLATHSMHATRLLLHVAAGLPEPTRDRDSEFAAATDDAESLLGQVDELAAECMAALDAAESADWEAIRKRTQGDRVIEMPAAYALIHAVDHLRGHADEASLTRHVWLARSDGAGIETGP